MPTNTDHRPGEKPKVKEEGPYGLELVLDLHGCPDETFEPELLKKACYSICKKIGMKAGPFHQWGTRKDEDQPTNPKSDGISSCLFIDTSSITIHAIDRLMNCYVNIFSCKMDWDTFEAAKEAQRILGGKIVRHKHITRA